MHLFVREASMGEVGFSALGYTKLFLPAAIMTIGLLLSLILGIMETVRISK